jgi:hypothetical protein
MRTRDAIPVQTGASKLPLMAKRRSGSPLCGTLLVVSALLTGCGSEGTGPSPDVLAPHMEPRPLIPRLGDDPSLPFAGASQLALHPLGTRVR